MLAKDGKISMLLDKIKGKLVRVFANSLSTSSYRQKATTTENSNTRQMESTPSEFAALPLSIDFEFYRKQNSDLQSMTDDDLASHYKTHGKTEGRITHSLALRKHLTARVLRASSILEIGPFCNPAIRGPNVKYFEVLDQAALIERAKIQNYKIEAVPVIHFLSSTGDLAVVDENFQCCFSSHVIEHQPDLVRHLQQVERILTDGGEYCLIIPDQRYCFDHYLKPSTIADVLNAYHTQRKVHDFKSIIEHIALTTHNEPARHWQGDHGEPNTPEHQMARVNNAIKTHKEAKGGYVDVHAWQFTPDSFYQIITVLNLMGLINLEPVHVFDTPHGLFEFTVVLKKSGNDHL